MFYNKKSLRSKNIKTIWHHPNGVVTDNRHDYDMYDNYIDEIDPKTRFENYYFISPFIAVRQYEKELEKLGQPYNYHKAIRMMVRDTIGSKTVNEDLSKGNTCLIFDMGVEYIEKDVYDMINEHFKKNEFHKNVKYWTMLENCDWQDVVEIVSASSSTCRFANWNYEEGIKQSEPEYYKTHYSPELESLTPKHFLFLNRRLRSHRVLLMAEFLNRNVELNKNFHLSFLGSENENITSDMERKTLMGYSYQFEHIDVKYFRELWDNWYGKKLPYSLETSRDEWLAGSNLNRITEMLPFRNKSYVELITEFTTKDDGYVTISEKLSQAILSKKPFIIAGDKHYIKVLKDFGFKTFDKFWSEDYDNLDYKDRIASIVDTVESIIKDVKIKTDKDNNIVYDNEMKRILEYNYNHYKNVFVKNVYKRIFKSLSIDNNLIMKPGSTKEQIKEFKFWGNHIWYHEGSNISFVPIYGNADFLFYDKIAPYLGFKLVNKDEIDIKKTRNLIFTRDPIKRFWYGVSQIAKNRGKTSEEIYKEVLEGNHLDSIYLEPQINFIDVEDVHCTFDVDNPVTNGLHNGSMWGYDEERGLAEREFTRDIYLIFQDYQMPIVPEFEVDEKIMDFYKQDYMFYYKKGSWRHRRPNNQNNMTYHFTNYLKDFNTTYADELSKISATKHSEYFKGSLKKGYWLNHCMIMDNIGLCFAPKDAKILDVGTHFGFIPHFLRQEGFTNVDSCNSYTEAGDSLPELKKIWDIMDIEPKDLHINTGKRFELDKKYDIIFITMSNIFWKSDKIVRLHNGSVNQSWEIVDQKGEKNTFFTPYEVSDLNFFMKNICEFLTPGGIAVVQPYPYVYNVFDGFKQERTMLNFYQNPEIGHEYPKSTEHNPNEKLNDYFVLQKDVNRNDKGPTW